MFQSHPRAQQAHVTLSLERYVEISRPRKIIVESGGSPSNQGLFQISCKQSHNFDTPQTPAVSHKSCNTDQNTNGVTALDGLRSCFRCLGRLARSRVQDSRALLVLLVLCPEPPKPPQVSLQFQTHWQCYHCRPSPYCVSAVRTNIISLAPVIVVRVSISV